MGGFVFVIVFAEAQYFPTPKECRFPLITIYTEDILYQWENCSPDLNIISKQEDQTYNLQLLDFTERSPDGAIVASLSSFSTMDSVPNYPQYAPSEKPYPIYETSELTNNPIATLYDITHEEITENGEKIGEKLNFTLPNVFTITYTIVNVTRKISYGGEILSIKSGRLKFDLDLVGWPFQSSSNTLDGFYKVFSNYPIQNCYFDRSPKEGESFTQFVCKGDYTDYFQLYPNFALINSRRDRHDISFSLLNQTKHDGTLFEGLSDDDDECGERKPGTVQSALFKISIPAFEGPLFYDPEISLLLSGSADGDKCDSDTDMNWTIWIASASSAAFCCIIIVIVLLLGELSCFRRMIYGKEGSRIRSARIAQKLVRKDFPSDYAPSNLRGVMYLYYGHF